MRELACSSLTLAALLFDGNVSLCIMHEGFLLHHVAFGLPGTAPQRLCTSSWRHFDIALKGICIRLHFMTNGLVQHGCLHVDGPWGDHCVALKLALNQREL